MKFINLRNYSENTLLKSSINVKDLVKRAKDEKLKAIAVSDTT
jgi:DNA polymerase III alpha subunit